jgi:hypothetical protein
VNPYAANPPSDSWSTPWSTPWLTPALVVSVLALLFTVGSFWWIQARRGRLRAFPSHSYAGAFSEQDLILSLPLVLHNTGPAPIVVLDFRLRIDKTEQQFEWTQSDGQADERALLPFYMSWRAVQMQLEPAGEMRGERRGERHMPSPLPVEGRRAVERFIEFGRKRPALVPLNGPYTVTVEVKLAHRPSWRPLLTFPLHTELVEEDGQTRYLTRTNDPGWEV